MTDNTNNITGTLKEELNTSCELFNKFVDETYEYVNSIFCLRKHKSDREYPVTHTFMENLLQNTELYTAYANDNQEEMKRIITKEAYAYIKAFNCIETYLKQLNNNIARFCIHLLDQTSLNVLHLEEMKREEERNHDHEETAE